MMRELTSLHASMAAAHKATTARARKAAANLSITSSSSSSSSSVVVKQEDLSGMRHVSHSSAPRPGTSMGYEGGQPLPSPSTYAPYPAPAHARQHPSLSLGLSTQWHIQALPPTATSNIAERGHSFRDPGHSFRPYPSPTEHQSFRASPPEAADSTRPVLPPVARLSPGAFAASQRALALPRDFREYQRRPETAPAAVDAGYPGRGDGYSPRRLAFADASSPTAAGGGRTSLSPASSPRDGTIPVSGGEFDLGADGEANDSPFSFNPPSVSNPTAAAEEPYQSSYAGGSRPASRRFTVLELCHDEQQQQQQQLSIIPERPEPGLHAF
jgi:hypothetical protein